MTIVIEFFAIMFGIDILVIIISWILDIAIEDIWWVYLVIMLASFLTWATKLWTIMLVTAVIAFIALFAYEYIKDKRK